jgi:hypothetical protein
MTEPEQPARPAEPIDLTPLIRNAPPIEFGPDVCARIDALPDATLDISGWHFDCDCALCTASLLEILGEA